MFWGELTQLQRELDNLFGADFFCNSTYGRGMFPAINVFENDHEITVKAELPGMSKKDGNIQLQGDLLTIAGERKSTVKADSKDEYYHRREIETGAFKRQLRLPHRVDVEKIGAKMEDGVLVVTLEKQESVKPRLISVS